MEKSDRIGCALCGGAVFGRIRMSPKRGRRGRPRKTEEGDRVYRVCEDCFRGVVLWLEASVEQGGPV